MKATHYRFTSTWHIPVSPNTAFDALRDIRAYPAWWPEIKEILQVNDDRVSVVCRSLLPYSLRFDLLRTIEDAEAMILETRLEGDLEGTTRWTITGRDGASVCRFDEQVVTNRRLLNALAPVARFAFRANHAIMMRNGRRGLIRFLRRSL